jgi:hypothetical protein
MRCLDRRLLRRSRCSGVSTFDLRFSIDLPPSAALQRQKQAKKDRKRQMKNASQRD